MDNPKLIEPTVRCRDSYLIALREYHAEGRFLDDAYEAVEKDFSAYVEREKSKARGENLRPGYIPETRLWLLEGKEYIGEVGIRHHLNEHLRQLGGHIGYVIRPTKRRQGYGTLILKLALPHAKQLGIEKVLLTCDVTNIGSSKVIEENGGVLENTTANPGQPDKARYWIELS